MRGENPQLTNLPRRGYNMFQSNDGEGLSLIHIFRKGRILQDAPTEELTAACWAVSGPAGVVDSWAAGRDVFTSSVLGGLKTVCIRGGGTEDLPAGLERRRVGLQEYFISLMEEEDQR